ncbi:MAG: glycosyltransferase family 2 protein [Actinomycetia bacterium]|nr:glycosyltransferase family 2 protein [Actinomycetes bacterium]MCP4957812.1 glycosyltransferase family 2 protein [Actinomycetes bacterium]
MISRFLEQFLNSGAVVLLVYAAFVSAFQLLLLSLGILELGRRRKTLRRVRHRQLLGSPLAPSIAVLVPAYNEEAGVVDTVRSVLALTYSNLEVVVISDGSSDLTVARLIDAFALSEVPPVMRRVLNHQEIVAVYRSPLEPRLVVVDKENGGKADALNAAINAASSDLVCAIDADTLIETDALLRLVSPFVTDGDVVAAGGTVRPVNDSLVTEGGVRAVRVPKNPLAGAQFIEYSRAFLYGRLGWNVLGGNVIVSGAFGLFDREAVIESGGYLHDTVGEDMELVVRLRRVGSEKREPVKIAYLPDPVTWTEVPETLTTLARQRNRWQRGLLDVLSRHKHMMGNPRYGTAGVVALPSFLVTEAIAPLAELLAWLFIIGGALIGMVDPNLALLYLTMAYGSGIALNLFTLMVDDVAFHHHRGFDSRLRLVGYAIFEQVGFRQMTVIWRLWGTLAFLQGKTEWGDQERKGFAQSTDRELVSAN